MVRAFTNHDRRRAARPGGDLRRPVGLPDAERGRSRRDPGRLGGAISGRDETPGSHPTGYHGPRRAVDPQRHDRLRPGDVDPTAPNRPGGLSLRHDGLVRAHDAGALGLPAEGEERLLSAVRQRDGRDVAFAAHPGPGGHGIRVRDPDLEQHLERHDHGSARLGRGPVPRLRVASVRTHPREDQPGDGDVHELAFFREELRGVNREVLTRRSDQEAWRQPRGHDRQRKRRSGWQLQQQAAQSRDIVLRTQEGAAGRGRGLARGRRGPGAGRDPPRPLVPTPSQAP